MSWLWRVQEEDAPPQIAAEELDIVITAQIIVAWAGEGGEEQRLAWWRSSMVSKYGGIDLLKRLLPITWRWAVLQAARETARSKDAELRQQDHDPDRIYSLYRFGYEVDRAIEERLHDLKQAEPDPLVSLPELGITQEPFSAARFMEWVATQGTAKVTTSPVGRRLDGAPPDSLAQCARQLVAALAPAAERYPLPHYRKAT